jgi:hypothetical protein
LPDGLRPWKPDSKRWLNVGAEAPAFSVRGDARLWFRLWHKRELWLLCDGCGVSSSGITMPTDHSSFVPSLRARPVAARFPQLLFEPFDSFQASNAGYLCSALMLGGDLARR